MCVDHCGLEVFVAEQLLDGSDIVALLQKVGGEAVPEGVDAGGLGDFRLPHGRFEGLLKGRGVDVVSPDDLLLIGLGSGCWADAMDRGILSLSAYAFSLLGELFIFIRGKWKAM